MVHRHSRSEVWRKRPGDRAWSTPMLSSAETNLDTTNHFGKLAEPFALFAAGIALSGALMRWLSQGEISVEFIGAGLFFLALGIGRNARSAPTERQ